MEEYSAWVGMDAHHKVNTIRFIISAYSWAE